MGMKINILWNGNGNEDDCMGMRGNVNKNPFPHTSTVNAATDLPASWSKVESLQAIHSDDSVDRFLQKK